MALRWAKGEEWNVLFAMQNWVAKQNQGWNKSKGWREPEHKMGLQKVALTENPIAVRVSFSVHTTQAEQFYSKE